MPVEEKGGSFPGVCLSPGKQTLLVLCVVLEILAFIELVCS